MSQCNLKILLTFDHELSLGGVRSYRQNLFDPTDHIFELANELDVPIVLFTDVCCAMRFRNWDHENFFKPYCDQIRKAMELNHDVQLHLHPHWIDSEYSDGRFVPSDTWTLAEFIERPPPHDIPGIVTSGINFLEEVCKPTKRDYRCVAYRGGGYNLAPNTKEILTALYTNGVRIDSSIVKGYRYHSRTNVVEFLNMPRTGNWIISPDGPLNKPAKRGILEIPIASRPRNPVNNVPHLVRRVFYPGRAYQSSGSIQKQSSMLDRLGRLFLRSAWPLTFDYHAQGLRHLMSVVRYHVDRHRHSREIIFSAISHPKNMGPYQRSLMRGFITSVRNEYGARLRFVTAREVYDELVESNSNLFDWTAGP